MKLFIAPLQGFTNAPFRYWHRMLFGGADAAFTPFLRMEKGEPCRRTLRDISSSTDAGACTVPQIIFRDAAEFSALSGELKARGFRRIDLNMGCPFPPQVGKGRGAGMLLRTEELERIAALVEADSEVRYSVKMRLGVDRSDQWEAVAPILARMPLEHVTVHPRTAREQYRGELHHDEFVRLAEAIGKPIVFNGEIRMPADISALAGRYPWLHGIMAGRGLLARPSLFAEYRSGAEWSVETRRREHMRLHDELLKHYENTLCGGHQILAGIRTFWEYAPEFIDRRIIKKLLKARDITDYRLKIAENLNP